MAIDSSGRFSSRPARTHRQMMFLPTRTMTSALHAPHRGTTSLIAPVALRRTVALNAARPVRPLVFGCLGPIPSVLLGDCRRSSEDSPLITDHCLTTVHILTRCAVKSARMFIFIPYPTEPDDPAREKPDSIPHIRHRSMDRTIVQPDSPSQASGLHCAE